MTVTGKLGYGMLHMLMSLQRCDEVRLVGVLEQLQKIAGGSEESTHVGSFFNPSRLVTADTTADWGDAPRSAMAATGGVRGMYGLSPRVPLPSSRAMSKKAKRTF